MLSLIIPAYNEAPNIARVLDVVTRMEECQEVIVVDDGSTDDTQRVASSYPVRVIRRSHNGGKGAALAAGLQAATSPFLLLLDADLIGLTAEHVRLLSRPVLNGDTAMTLGVFTGGRFATDLAQRITPSLTGQRALRREVLATLPGLEAMRYGVDLALTQHARRGGWPVQVVELHDMTQQMKEEKLGLSRGLLARCKMYWEILRVIAK